MMLGKAKRSSVVTKIVLLVFGLQAIAASGDSKSAATESNSTSMEAKALLEFLVGRRGSFLKLMGHHLDADRKSLGGKDFHDLLVRSAAGDRIKPGVFEVVLPGIEIPARSFVASVLAEFDANSTMAGIRPSNEFNALAHHLRDSLALLALQSRIRTESKRLGIRQRQNLQVLNRSLSTMLSVRFQRAAFYFQRLTGSSEESTLRHAFSSVLMRVFPKEKSESIFRSIYFDSMFTRAVIVAYTTTEASIAAAAEKPVGSVCEFVIRDQESANQPL